MGQSAHRALAAAGTIVAAAAFTLAGALPAQATSGDCVGYLAQRGYVIGSGVINACNLGESIIGRPYCVVRLATLGVPEKHNTAACNLAGK
ncbi:hypothetical protein OOZ19_28915 [Saccharopolyspora sp. NFXS83]|uniref:hypothetical protein n=1 Tax=Saccharopolyspora sp. NFXS83 TaxID=2993560 RepID=UPI00224B2AB8|nr:hypothetical protein [Saccharopolyspora sp. NFXS83]MCX2734284.1 hypothetical protein [Saccharopolyspora sp. NFXS83]